MRRALLLIALGGCASAGTPSPNDASARQATIFTDPSTATIMAEAPRAVSLSLAKPPAAVWLAVKKVYSDIEVPLGVENPAAHQLGNADFYKSRQFAGMPMAQLVDCGSGMTGPKAASYRIYMSLLTTVSGDGKGGTTVKTTFTASGQDVSAGSSDKIVCGTSGRLENLFLDKVKALVGG